MKRDIFRNNYIGGPNGAIKKCNVYKDLLFQLNGLVNKTDVVELTGLRCLLSQPICVRYKSVIDKTTPQILIMEPLPGEENHHA